MRECFVCNFEPQIVVMYPGVTNNFPTPAVFYLGLMGTCLPYSLIKLGIIQRSLWSRVVSQSCHWNINPKYLVFDKLMKNIFTELIFQIQHILYLHMSQPSSNSTPFLMFYSRSSIWPMTWPVRWCGSLTWLVWCCCSVTGMAAYSSWFQCCRTSPQTAGCPSTRWR